MSDRDLPAFDCYGVLGVPVTASLADIERAFRVAAKREHPDVRAAPSGDATQRMQRLNVARDWLTDPDRRARYDAARGLRPAAALAADLPDIDPLGPWPDAIGDERRGSQAGPLLVSIAMMVLITLVFVGSASLLVALIAVGAIVALAAGVVLTILGALR